MFKEVPEWLYTRIHMWDEHKELPSLPCHEAPFS